MLSIVILGLVVGIRHALEADHVCAVASLVANGVRGRGAAGLGAIWGLGHASMLLAVGGIALLSGTRLPESWSPLFEFAIGLMLLFLGADVLRRHVTQRPHAATRGKKQVPLARAFAVGVAHGLAGSAALMLLISGSAASRDHEFLELVAFGVGSIAGMAMLSLLLYRSIHYTNVRARAVGRGFVILVGLTTVALGSSLVLRHSTQLFATG